MKTAKMKILLLSIVLLSSFFAEAQFTPVPMTMNTPMGPIHTTHYIYMPYRYGGISNYNPKYKFTVQLKNDSLFTCKSRMESANKRMYIVYKDQWKDEIKVYPSDTKSLSAQEGMTGIMYGMPADSCWLFRVVKGPIVGYSSIPSTDVNSVIAIQKGTDQEIISLTRQHLTEMVSDLTDEKINKWLEKGHLTKVIGRYNKLKSGQP
jgi:hypothetical protein